MLKRILVCVLIALVVLDVSLFALATPMIEKKITTVTDTTSEYIVIDEAEETQVKETEVIVTKPVETQPAETEPVETVTITEEEKRQENYVEIIEFEGR